MSLSFYRALKKFRDSQRDRLIKIPGLIRPVDGLCKILRPKGLVKLSLERFNMSVDGNDIVIGNDLLLHGIYEPEVTELFKKTIKPGMTVLDLGANAGYFSLLAASLIGPTGRVYAFEPDPHNLKILRMNIDENQFKTVIPVPLAISNESKTAVLYRDAENLGLHTLSPANLPHGRGQTLSITTQTLDHWMTETNISQVHFVKMDIQGAEGLALACANQLLKQASLNLVFEFWPAGLRELKSDPLAVLRRLKDQGYRIGIISSKGSILEPDTLESLLQKAEAATYLNLFARKGNL